MAMLNNQRVYIYIYTYIYSYPIGSMYAIYGNMDPINIPPIWHIYQHHGSYGHVYTYIICISGVDSPYAMIWPILVNQIGIISPSTRFSRENLTGNRGLCYLGEFWVNPADFFADVGNSNLKQQTSWEFWGSTSITDRMFFQFALLSGGFEVASCHIRYIKQHRWQNHWW